MRLKLTLIVFGALLLLTAGIRPDALPYSDSESSYSDSVTSHWPNALFLREAVLERGEFPVWRETIMAGQPFAANPLNKTAYPLQWLVLLFQPALHLNIMIILHLVIAGSGMWLWARSLGLRIEAVGLCAAAYVFAPQIIGRLGAGHLDIVYAMAWWPWLMWAIKHLSEHSDRKTIRVLQTSFMAGLVLLADVRTGFFALAAAGVYEIILLVQQGKLKEAMWHLWIVPIFLLLTLSLLVPLRLWQPYLNRAMLTADDAGTFSLEVVHFLGLILPALKNIETQTYFGIPVFALAVSAFITAHPQKRRLWLAAGLVIVLYSMGSNGLLWPLLVKVMPILLWFRIPARAWLILTLFIPILAGYGLQRLLEYVESHQIILNIRRYNLLIALSTLIVLIVGIFGLAVLRLPVGAVIPIGLGSGVILLAALNGRLKPRYIFPLILGLTLLDLGLNGYQTAHWRGADFWLEAHRPLAERLAAENPTRIYSPTYSLEQQVAEAYHLRLLGGVDPFQLAGVVAGIEVGSGVTYKRYNPVVPPLEGIENEADLAQANLQAIMNTQILAEWQVSHIISGHPLDNSRLKWLDTVNGVYIYQNLDYAARSDSPRIPDWPPGWAGLPSPETVQQLNQITIVSAAISSIGWIVVVIVLIFLSMQSRRQPLKARLA